MMKLSHSWKIICWTVGIIVLAVLSFQYFFITRGFPTGDDPAAHLRLIDTTSYQRLFLSNYPLPESILKFLHSILPISLPLLFTITISIFFFLSVLGYLFFSKKVSSSYLVAFASAAIFATGTWVNDGLRMGVIAETFGWGMLIFALIALMKQNIPLVVLSAGFLAFSHPFSFVIYVFVAIMYLLILLFSKENKEKRFAIITGSLFATSFLLIWLFDPSLVNKFINFINVEAHSVGWGERTLWVVLTDGEPRKILVAVFALIGVISSIKNWSKPGIKISYLLLFVGLFMSMNQIFGIRFLVFRFYPYLEMGLAIFAALGIEYLFEKYNFEKYKIPALLALTAILIAPGFINNARATYFQVNDVTMNDSATAGDRSAIKWIGENLPRDFYMNAQHKKAIWIRAIDGSDNIAEDLPSFDQSLANQFVANGGTFAYDYIYYSGIEIVVPAQISASYKLIYDRDGVKIYQR